MARGRNRKRLLPLLSLPLFLASSACAPSDPLDVRIDAGSVSAYHYWNYKYLGYAPKELQQEYRDALTEVRFEFSTKYGATASFDQEAIDRQMREMQDGLTLREFIITGLTCRQARLEKEIAAREAQAGTNLRALSHSTDPAVTKILRENMKIYEARVEKLDAELLATRRRIGELDPQSAFRPRPPPPDPRQTI